MTTAITCKPRVMHLLWTYEVGGAEVVALNLAETMREEFELSVCAVQGNGEMKARFAQTRIPTETVSPNSTGGAAGKIWRLARLLRQRKIEVLHCHNRPAQLYGVLCGRLAGVPVIVCTRHGIGASDSEDQAGWLERRLARAVSHHVAVCQAALQQGIRHSRISAERSSSILNGIDVSRFLPRSAHDSAAGRTCVIGCVARLQKLKGHSHLLNVARKLVDAGMHFEMQLIGDGAERTTLEAQAKQLGVLDKVKFLGMRRDVAATLREMDIFVLPSLTEGLPLTVLEAMAAGLPVVATRVGGIPEVVRHGETGLLVPPAAENDLFRAIAELIGNETRRRSMGQCGRMVAVDQFDLKLMACRHAELYRKLLAERG